ncbi:MAG TPA: hypothetical protein VFI73_02235 [Candidatus Nitrosopolaris sp.]|nr:hypothetical protein [Candidatus Nitrosopolaris sp.]
MAIVSCVPARESKRNILCYVRGEIQNQYIRATNQSSWRNFEISLHGVEKELTNKSAKKKS